MSDTGHYRAVAEGFTRTLHAVNDDQWDLPTPCPDWTVADLVGHVIATHRRVRAMLGEATTPPELALPAAWDDAHGAMVAALDDPVLAATPVRARSGEQSFASLVGSLVTYDTLCHTWDLARAIGADETLDPGAVADAHESLAVLDDVLRVPGGFGAKVEPAPDADAQTRFLNFVGRRP